MFAPDYPQSKYSNKVLRVGETYTVDSSQHQMITDGCLSREWKDLFLFISIQRNL